MDKSTINGPCSLAILNNQMVSQNWLVVGIPTPLKK
jgi:hypothetical protein